ncbi:hydrogen peroxide-inducible genes activator [Qipengyuania soli]|uniref:LysR family transcriptional regulator n=1 Tax=Qipengyuania soli TaxID=2782568 RepID=A0A7S8F5M3_9SPHN|nr:hydrogen peroxide-inducible genes activator [Qipengyuania soli]QPC99659.1 LysR family transcriptional regulator [Qipengyuania soli]
MPSIRQFEMFAKIAETGSMGEAALALGLTQPALSQQLRSLEDALGLKLFERVPKGMQLTPGGRELIQSARSVLGAVRDFGEVADRVASRPAGTIRFGVTPTIGPYLMPQVIKELHRRYPALRLYIREGIPSVQQGELAAGELDMVLSPMPIAGRGLHIEPLFREPLRIVAPPDDPLLTLDRLTRRSFGGRTFLTLDHRHHYHRQLEGVCAQFGATILADYEGTSLDALRQMAASGVGLAMLPEIYVRSNAGGIDGVRIAEPGNWTEYRSVGAAWRSSAVFAKLYQEVADIVSEEARRLLAN